MAFTPSRQRIAPMVAKVESSYAVDPTPAGGTDDVLAIESPTPYNPEYERFEFRPHGSTFTRQLDIIGQRVGTFDAQCLLQGSGTRGTAAINGFAGMSALLQCCGITQTVNASTSIVFTPSTIAALKSATIYFEANGALNKVNGAYGDLTIRGDPRSAPTCRVRGLGKYVAPALGTISGWVGGTNRAVANLGVSGTINNGAAYTPVFLSYEFNTGNQIDRLPDMNDSTGLKSLVFGDRNPTLRISVALDTDGAAGVAYSEWFADIVSQTPHALAWSVGTATGNTIAFSFPTAQPIAVRHTGVASVNALDLTYKIQHAAAESEFSITVT